MYRLLVEGQHDRCRERLEQHLADSERAVLASLDRA
jgi:hypothetical protein